MIVDFGLAKDMRSLASIQSQDFLGTLAYASPEHLAGNASEREVGHLVAGGDHVRDDHAPTAFPDQRRGGNRRQDRKSDRRSCARNRRGSPKDAEAVVGKCLEKDPRNRYGSAQGLKEDIDRVLTGRPVTARPIGRIGRQLKRAKKEPPGLAARSGPHYLRLDHPLSRLQLRDTQVGERRHTVL